MARQKKSRRGMSPAELHLLRPLVENERTDTWAQMARERRGTNQLPSLEAVDRLLFRFHVDDDAPPTDDEWAQLGAQIEAVKLLLLTNKWTHTADAWIPRLEWLQAERERWAATRGDREQRAVEPLGAAVTVSTMDSIKEGWPRDYVMANAAETLRRLNEWRDDHERNGRIVTPADLVEFVPSGGRSGTGGIVEKQAPDGDDAASGKSWQEVRDELDGIRLAGERWTSYEKMARRLGSTKRTVHAAVQRGTAELQEWARSQKGKQSSRKLVGQGSAEIVLANAADLRVGNPADVLEQADIERALAKLINEAQPAERARIHEMDLASKRKLAQLYCEQQRDRDSND